VEFVYIVLSGFLLRYDIVAPDVMLYQVTLLGMNHFESISCLLKLYRCCDGRTYLHISDQRDAKHANEKSLNNS
jgi:hypothetical protein